MKLFKNWFFSKKFLDIFCPSQHCRLFQQQILQVGLAEKNPTYIDWNVCWLMCVKNFFCVRFWFCSKTWFHHKIFLTCLPQVFMNASNNVYTIRNVQVHAGPVIFLRATLSSVWCRWCRVQPPASMPSSGLTSSLQQEKRPKAPTPPSPTPLLPHSSPASLPMSLWVTSICNSLRVFWTQLLLFFFIKHNCCSQTLFLLWV